MAKKNKEIVKVKEEEALPEFLAKTEGTTEGLENMRAGDLLIPRLILMQALSPRVVDKDGAESGDMFNSVTNELVLAEGESMLFVPVYHYIEWIKWADRESSESILDRSLDPESVLAQSAARQEKRTNLKGQEVWVVTEYHNFVVLVPEMNPRVPMVISCAKTNHRQGKKLLSLARFRGKYPLYAGKYSFRSKIAENKDGNKYYTFDFDNAGFVKDEALFNEAKELYPTIRTAFEESRLVADQQPEEEKLDETEI